MMFNVVEVVDLIRVGDLDLAGRDVVHRRMRNVHRHVNGQFVLFGDDQRLG